MAIIISLCMIILGLVIAFTAPGISQILLEKKQAHLREQEEFKRATRKKFATLFDEKNYQLSYTQKGWIICTLKHIPSKLYLEYCWQFEVHGNFYKEIDLPPLISNVLSQQEKKYLQDFLGKVAEEFLQQQDKENLEWSKQTFISKESE